MALTACNSIFLNVSELAQMYSDGAIGKEASRRQHRSTPALDHVWEQVQVAVLDVSTASQVNATQLSSLQTAILCSEMSLLIPGYCIEACFSLDKSSVRV